jgi:hypothetical protein
VGESYETLLKLKHYNLGIRFQPQSPKSSHVPPADLRLFIPILLLGMSDFAIAGNGAYRDYI